MNKEKWAEKEDSEGLALEGAKEREDEESGEEEGQDDEEDGVRKYSR